MNYAHFAGRLGRDAEIRHTQDGKAVCNFALAVDVGWGERKETLWIDCALWGERSEKLAPYLTKGKPITVSGDIGLRTFEKRDGTSGATITLNVQRVTLQGGANSEAAHQGPSAAAQPEAKRSSPAPAKPKPAAPAAAADFDDEFGDSIPF